MSAKNRDRQGRWRAKTVVVHVLVGAAGRLFLL